MHYSVCVDIVSVNTVHVAGDSILIFTLYYKHNIIIKFLLSGTCAWSTFMIFMAF